jgi:hypothetical protein
MPMTEAIINLINHAEPEAVILIVGLLLLAIIGIVGGLLYEYRKRQAETELKREMIARGMSAEEIKTVLEAGPK